MHRARANQPHHHMVFGPDPAQEHVSLSSSCPHVGARV